MSLTPSVPAGHTPPDPAEADAPVDRIDAGVAATKALLVDDHTLFREGLALLMAERFPEVHLLQVSDLTSALVHLSADRGIDLLLLDLGLRDSQGTDSLPVLRSVAPDLTVVVLSADERPETILASIELGAAGFIPKTARSGAIEAALRVVLGGGIYLPPQLFRHLPAFDLPLPDDSLTAAERQLAVIWELGLTPRQVDVLRLLVVGLSTKVIARQLGLAESSVKTHLLGLFRRLGVSSRVQAVIAAARAGLRFDH